MNTRFVISIVTVIAIIIVILVGFSIAYRLYLYKWIGSWASPILCKLPIIGRFITGTTCEGLSLNKSISLTRANILADRPELGTRGGTRAFGHARACAWDPKLCNVWDNSPLKNIAEGGGGRHTNEQAQIIHQEDERAMKYQTLWEPIKRKVFRNMSIPGSPRNFNDVIGRQTEMRNTLQRMFGGNEGDSKTRKGNDKVNIRLPTPKIV